MIADAGRRHALVVATAQYEDPKLRQLRAPAADAERLASVLRDPGRGAFEVDTLVDPDQGTLARRIAAFFRDRRPDELLLLHFSCHGVKDDRGELYLAARDTEVDLLSATGISASWLNEQITRTRSRRTVVLLDCCFSGSFPFGMHARAGTTVDVGELQGRGRAIITASSSMEYAYEGDELTGEGRPSVFTEAVVEGLESGRADLDHDHLISVDDLYNYVYDRVKERTPSQTPNKKSELEGPLYLAASSYEPEVEPATLDRELLARTEDRYAGVREGAVLELAGLVRSRDPAVALAARRALEPMLEDDSRRVAARAQEALEGAGAEPPAVATRPAAGAAMVAEPAASSSAAAPVAAGAPAAAAAAAAEPVAPTKPARPRSRRRRVPRIALALAGLAVVGILAVVLASSGGSPQQAADSGSSSSQPSWLPSWCKGSEDPQGASDLGAQAAFDCDLSSVDVPPDVHDPGVTFAKFAGAEEARAIVPDAHDFLIKNQGRRPCDAATTKRIGELYDNGRAECLFRPSSGEWWIGWNDDGSDVAGFATFGKPTTGNAAAEAWATMT